MSLACEYCDGLILDMENCATSVDIVEVAPDLKNMVRQYECAKNADGQLVEHFYHKHHAMTGAILTLDGTILQFPVLRSGMLKQVQAFVGDYNRQCAIEGRPTWDRVKFCLE